LRRLGADGRAGGIALAAGTTLAWTSVAVGAVVAAAAVGVWLAWLVHVFVLYSLLALGDLVRHVWRVERAVQSGDLVAARAALGNLVGRDTALIDGAGCRRAAIESLSESLTDGFTSPLFWYVLGGLPGLVAFKVVSTLDSMVGYRTPRYARFGWAGARADDVMNFVPARMTWLSIAAAAIVVPGASLRRALVVGRAQHAVLPGPNAGWSEAATAGAIRRRLVGPIRIGGVLVTDAWVGDPADPPAGTHEDTVRAVAVVATAALIAASLAIAALTVFDPPITQ
jgi:adenosylcobinamide-phosphate synthase